MIQPLLLPSRQDTSQVHRVQIFHDERTIRKEWLYHGFLIVPSAAITEVRETLKNLRKTEKEIRFSELTASASTSRSTATALEWARYYRDRLYLIARFHTLGVNLRNIDLNRFGAHNDLRSQKEHRAYNRFFEIGLYGGLRFFYPTNEHVVIEEIYSHNRLLQKGDPFINLPIYKINQRETNIEVSPVEIKQVSTSPVEEQGYPEIVDLVSLADVVVGAHSHNLDYTSHSKTGCDEVADLILEITEKLTKTAFNTNSRYWKRYAMSFFPLITIAESDLWASSLGPDLFYRDRNIKRQPRRQMQLPL